MGVALTVVPLVIVAVAAPIRVVAIRVAVRMTPQVVRVVAPTAAVVELVENHWVVVWEGKIWWTWPRQSIQAID